MIPSFTHSDHVVEIINQIVDDLNMGLMLIGTDERVIRMNPIACELFCVHPDLWWKSGKKLDEYVAQNTAEYKILHSILASPEPLRNNLVNWECNGEFKHILIDTYPFSVPQGETNGICIVLKDVGNLVTLEQNVQRNDKLATIGKIAAGIAHEIRNPLTSIKGFLQIMHDDTSTSPISKYKMFTEVMLTEINRINGLVSELLLLSKPNHVKFRSIDVGHIISDLTPIIQSQALLYNIELKFQLFETPLVYADSEMLKQVFLNLMKNAIEAMPDGGILTVTTVYEKADQFVRVDFQDTGVGIPFYMMDRIFDAFYTTKESGTGLGLSICQRIIHDLGGTIRVSSKGFGTTFTVILPVNSKDGDGGNT